MCKRNDAKTIWSDGLITALSQIAEVPFVMSQLTNTSAAVDSDEVLYTLIVDEETWTTLYKLTPDAK